MKLIESGRKAQPPECRHHWSTPGIFAAGRGTAAPQKISAPVPGRSGREALRRAFRAMAGKLFGLAAAKAALIDAKLRSAGRTARPVATVCRHDTVRPGRLRADGVLRIARVDQRPVASPHCCACGSRCKDGAVFLALAPSPITGAGRRGVKAIAWNAKIGAVSARFGQRCGQAQRRSGQVPGYLGQTGTNARVNFLDQALQGICKSCHACAFRAGRAIRVRG
jgi:hypothetical protein